MRRSLDAPPPMRSMAGGGRGGGGMLQRWGDWLRYSLDVAQNIIVPEAQHAMAARHQIGGAPRIARDALILVVLPAVELNHETGLMTCKVRVVGADRCLSTKVRTMNRKMPQMLP